MRRLWMAFFAMALVSLSRPMPAASPPDPGGAGPYSTANYSCTTTNPDTGDAFETIIYYPASGGAVDPSGAPYAAIVFAHGFMARPEYYPGNAEHLASWGYVVALPDLPDDDTEARQSDARHVLTYLAEANDEPSSPLYGMVDAARLGITGHSLGGLTAMIVAARDARIRAAVALDPTNPETGFDIGAGLIGEPWDYETEAPSIAAPILILGAPSQMCNANANYNAMYAHVGSAHRTKLVLADASHCDFMVTDNALHVTGCTLFCGGDYSEARATLIQRYSTAWFNYYLRGQAEYYPYLYGAEAEADVNQGRIVEREAYASVRGVSAVAEAGGIRLTWTASDDAVVVGYNVYRRTESGQYPVEPRAQVGRQSWYLDTGVVPGERYFYVLRSRDAAANEHAASAEVSAVAEPTAPPTIEPPGDPGEDRARTYLPFVNR